MARRRWYRRSVRVVAAKKKWASHLSHDTMSFDVDALTGIGHGSYELAFNKTNGDAPTPTIVKTGNFKVQGDCYVNSNAGTTAIQPGFAVTVYVMYVPEGIISLTNYESLIENHPEWILAWKVLDVGVGSNVSNGNSFSMSSRLKRNLNSGDEVMLIALATGPTNYTPKVTITFTAQYYTCAN